MADLARLTACPWGAPLRETRINVKRMDSLLTNYPGPTYDRPTAWKLALARAFQANRARRARRRVSTVCPDLPGAPESCLETG
ncbi:hypothetical protein PUN4_120046 [Paraburkholderia unamae]|nr:hypothetical protein PUN4_120046 [Paraburkholderia unamae]